MDTNTAATDLLQAAREDGVGRPAALDAALLDTVRAALRPLPEYAARVATNTTKEGSTT